MTSSKLFLTLAFCALSLNLIAQREGIKKGDREVNMNGNINYTTFGEGDTKFSSTSGFFSVSMGKYVNDLMIVGIAPGLSVSQYGADAPVEYDYNVQVFTNVNFVKRSAFIPYGRLTLFKGSFKTEGNTYIQAGGGVKLFFAERAAWDSLVTYGFGISDSDQGSILFLTGLSYIF